MKKTIFAALALLTAMVASAEENTMTYDGSMLYGYCTTPSGALSFASTTDAGMAFQFTERDIAYFTGCKITAIAVVNGSAAKGSAATEQPITLFTASGFNDMNVAENMETYPGVMDLTKPGEYKEYPLPEPIEILDDMDPFWVGMTAECNPAVAGVLSFDGWQHDASIPGGMVGIVNQPGEPMVWVDMADRFGFGCVRVKIEGKNFPADEASILDCYIPEYVCSGTEETISFYVRNEAGNDIKSLTLAYTLGSEEENTETYTIEPSLVYNNFTELQLKLNMPERGVNDLKLNMRITEVNGVSNNATAATTETEGYMLAMPAGVGYRRNMVAEIGTGTWCGYCPMGIVGVSKMLKKHTDGTFIPIAVHIKDAMSTASYDLYQTNYTSNAPTLVVNRNTSRYGMQNPSYEIMNEMYPAVLATPAVAEVRIDGIEFDPKAKRINVEASTEFAIDTDGDYALSFVLTEDNVGPYMQLNYYYQEGAPVMGEWNSLPEYNNIMFGSVARQINLYNGLNETVPASVKAGETNKASGFLRTNTVQNIDNCHIIVLLINRTTGRIENAVTADYTTLGIEAVDADSADEAGATTWYDLQGRPVSEHVKGNIYLKHQGSRTVKVLY